MFGAGVRAALAAALGAGAGAAVGDPVADRLPKELLAALGAWMGPSALLPIVLLSSLIGAIVGGPLMALRKQQRDVPMPFGPYIAAAGWVWLLVGDQLLSAYMRMTGLE